MRVLLVAHAFPPRSTAGVEVYTQRLARALRELGQEVLVLTAVHDLSAEHGAVAWLRRDGIAVAEVVSIHRDGTLEATYDDPVLDSTATAVIERFRPDVVHIQHLLNLTTAIPARTRERGAAVAMTLHDYWLSCPRDGLRVREDLGLCATMDHDVCARCLTSSPYLAPALQRTLAGAARRAGVGRHLHRVHDLAPRLTERALALMRRVSSRPRDLAGAMDRRADALSAAMRHVQVFLAPTNFARQRALELGIPAAAVRTLPLGVVAEGGRPRRSGTRPRLGYVGTLAPHKGVHVLLQAFRGIAERGVTLDLYGSLSVHPSYAAELRRMAAGDERIRFHGAFPEGAQTSVFDALDALVLPSMWWENSPLTVLEALAAGRPVVASATGGVPEIVEDGDTGLLVPPGDVVALRRALVDVATGRSLGSARGPVRLKTVREGAQELLALYGSLVAAPTHVESA